MENTIKHLLMIQNVISRMAHNSFLIKGWGISLISILFALIENQTAHEVLKWLPVFPLLTFWLLDGYFLHQERLYRELYNAVRSLPKTDFSMNTSTYQKNIPSWVKTCLSKTLILFYLPIAIMIIVINIFGLIIIQ